MMRLNTDDYRFCYLWQRLRSHTTLLLVLTLVATVAQAGPNDDKDGDGLTTKEEKSYGTKPKKADTDKDGLSDGEEKIVGERIAALFGA